MNSKLILSFFCFFSFVFSCFLFWQNTKAQIGNGKIKGSLAIMSSLEKNEEISEENRKIISEKMFSVNRNYQRNRDAVALSAWFMVFQGALSIIVFIYLLRLDLKKSV